VLVALESTEPFVTVFPGATAATGCRSARTAVVVAVPEPVVVEDVVVLLATVPAVFVFTTGWLFSAAS
jgi:hypothetical protein